MCVVVYFVIVTEINLSESESSSPTSSTCRSKVDIELLISGGSQGHCPQQCGDGAGPSVAGEGSVGCVALVLELWSYKCL